MTDPICLTDTELEGLRELLAFVSIIEDRAFRNEKHMAEITAEMWRDMTAGPKRKLSRLGGSATAKAARLLDEALA